MHKRLKYRALLCTSTLLLLAACGGEAPPEPAQDLVQGQGNPPPTAGSPAGPTPGSDALPQNIDYISREELKSLKGKDCDLLTAGDIEEIAIPVGIEITNFSIMGCQYSWKKLNASEIESKNQEVVAKAMAEGLSFIEIGKLQAPTENSVNLFIDTYSAPQNKEMIDVQYRSLANMLSNEEKARNAAALKKAFEQVSSGNEGGKPLTETEKSVAGKLMGVIQQEVQQDIYVPVEGVGLRAAWSDYSNKLVVQYRNMFFTLHVDTGDDQRDLKLAKTLATSTIGRLNSAL